MTAVLVVLCLALAVGVFLFAGYVLDSIAARVGQWLAKRGRR